MSVNRQNPEAGFVTVRAPLDPAEWDRLYTLRWKVLRKPWGQPPGSERDPLDTIATHRIAVTDSGEILGVGRLHLNSPVEGQIRFMAVEEARRGGGIGTLILQALETEARRLKINRVILEARREAIPFYLRQGYRVIAPGKVLFGTIAHSLMAKELVADHDPREKERPGLDISAP